MEQNESTVIKFNGLNRYEILIALYNFSHPQGLGILHFDNKPLTMAEAKEVLKRSDHVDYLKGLVIKVWLPENADEFDCRLYDRDCGQGAAKAAIERYKRLGFF